MTPRHFGAQGNGSDDTQAFQDWLLNTTVHTGEGHIPDGLYMLSGTVSNTSVFRDFKVTASPGAMIIAAPGMTHPMFNIAGDVCVDWSGGVYDFSEGTHRGGEQSSTCLAFSGLDMLNVRDAKFLGAVGDHRDETGDCGITEVSTKSGTIERCGFFGFSDAGIYPSGGSSPGPEDDGLSLTIRECLFEKNAVAVSSRRNRRATKFINTTCDGNGIDFFEVHIDDLGSAQRSLVSGLHSTNAGSRSINFRGSIGGIITDNCIEDFGYDLDGNPFSLARGIMIEGTSETVIANNNIRLHSKDRTGAHIGISFQEYTIDSEVRSAMDNAVNGNIISGMQWGMRSISSPGPNYGRGNIIRDTTYTLDVDGDIEVL